MNVSIEKSGRSLVFGRGMILSGIEAEPLTYNGDFPTLPREDMTPCTRHIMLEGHIVSVAATPEGRAGEIGNRRGALARMTCPGDSFIIRIGDKYAVCRDGEVTFRRESPFSGDAAERFYLRAVIDGGFFRKSSTKAVVKKLSDGAYLPGYIEDAMTARICNGSYAVEIENSGDVPVGFTAEFSLSGTSSSFSLVNTVNYKRISCSYDFVSGDVIRISTMRDSLYFTLTRNGEVINLTGLADDDSELFLIPNKRCVLTVGDGDIFSGSVTYSEAFVSF